MGYIYIYDLGFLNFYFFFSKVSLFTLHVENFCFLKGEREREREREKR